MVTSHPDFMTISIADYTGAVHSNPWIDEEMSGEAMTAPTVVKLVAYTQKQLSTLVNDKNYAETALRRYVEEAKEKELCAMRKVEPLDASIDEAGALLAATYEQLRPRTKEPKLVRDETVNAHYFPPGMGIRGQGQHAHERCRPILLLDESRTFPYLRNSTYDARTQSVYPLSAEVLRAAGVVLGAAAEALALASPEVLVAGRRAVGAHMWGDSFCAVPVHLQGGREMRAIHCAQLGLRIADGSHGERRGFMPTARHADAGDVSKKEAGDAQGIIVYLPVF